MRLKDTVAENVSLLTSNTFLLYQSMQPLVSHTFKPLLREVDNLANAFAILLVSKNYKGSEICLNEMGAVWAIDKRVKAYVFPDLQEESVGWLINTNAAEKLNDQTALASLYAELQQFYSLPLSIPGWTAQAKAFCDNFK